MVYSSRQGTVHHRPNGSIGPARGQTGGGVEALRKPTSPNSSQQPIHPQSTPLPNKTKQGRRIIWSLIPAFGLPSLCWAFFFNFIYFPFFIAIGATMAALYRLKVYIYALATYPMRLYTGEKLYTKGSVKWEDTDRQMGTGSVESPYFVLVIGTGFSGLAIGMNLVREGLQNFVLLERDKDLGGTWYANSYPGCACDVPSSLYSFSFETSAEWSRMWGTYKEIYEYLVSCAKKYGLYEHCRFQHTVVGATWDENRGLWEVKCENGAKFYSRVLCNCQGFLSDPSIPKIPGVDKFKGDWWHSAQWRHDVSLQGKTVAVIGTGASAIQFVPQITPKVSKLLLFQRTPPWVWPHLTGSNPRMPVWIVNQLRKHAFLRSALRFLWYAGSEGLFSMFTRFGYWIGRWAFEVYSLRDMKQNVPDLAKRNKLVPTFEIGCKRFLLSSAYPGVPSYYGAVGQDHVELITEGIERITEKGVVTKDGTEHQVDIIVYGTGFSTIRSEAGNMLNLVGRKSATLKNKWRTTMVAYKGTTLSEFPNYFMLLGPNLNLGHSSVVFMMECQVHYIMQALRYMRAKNLKGIDVKQRVMDKYNDWIVEEISDKVWQVGGCQSWYKDASGHNPILWPSFCANFRAQTEFFDQKAYTEMYYENA